MGQGDCDKQQIIKKSEDKIYFIENFPYTNPFQLF